MPNVPRDLRDLIGTRAVAARLGYDASTVHRLVDSGQLAVAAKAPGLRGAYLFTDEEVTRFEKERGWRKVPA